MAPNSSPSLPPPGVTLTTLLLTDLVESTRLVERLGDARAYQVHAAHDRLARDLLVRHGGQEIDKTDGFLFLFDRPLDALRFALEYHRELEHLSRRERIDLEARVGIHLGEVFLRQNSSEDIARGAKPVEVEGLAKPMAARLMALAKGGQTLLSREAYEVCRRGLGVDTGTGSGEAKSPLAFRDHGSYRFKGVAEPVKVYEIGAPEHAPLIAPPSSEKGWREGSGGVAGLRHALWHSSRSRGLTVVGGVALVLLVVIGWWQLAGRGGARPSVAVLGFHDLSPTAESGWVNTALSEMMLTELAAGGDLRLISGENVARLRRELDFPLGTTLAPDTLQQIRTNLGTDFVAQGSYRLDNGRLEPLQVTIQDTASGEVVADYQQSGPRDRLYQLVSDAGQVLRRELGVGRISDAEAASARRTLSEDEEAFRLYSEGLSRLRNYDVLEASEYLQEAVQEDPAFALAHVALSQAWSQLGYDARAEESARRASELTAGLPREDQLIIEGRYYETSGQWDEAAKTYEALWHYHPDDLDHGLRLVRALFGGGRNAEALQVLRQLRERSEVARQDPRLDAAEARIHWQLSDYETYLAVSAQAVQRAQSRDASILLAEILLRRGWIQTRLGNYAAARKDLEEARRLFREAGDRAWAVRVSVSLAILEDYQGDMPRAERIYRQALADLEEIGHREAVATILNNLSGVVREQGHLGEADRMLDRALEDAREIASRSLDALTHENRSLLLLERGDLEGARDVARRAMDIYEEIEERSGIGWVMWDLGQIHLAAGDLDLARQTLEEALAENQKLGYLHLVGAIQTTLGQVYAASGDLEAARAVFTDAVSLRTRLGENGTLAETRLARAEMLLGEGKYAQAASVASSTLEQLTAEGKSGRRLEALAVLAEALLGQGQLDRARQALAGASSAVAHESPLVRIRVRIAQGRLLAAQGQEGRAEALLRSTIEEAEQQGLVSLSLEARLALAEAELAVGRAGAAESRLRELLADAEERGFGLLAQRTRTRLEHGRAGPGGG